MMEMLLLYTCDGRNLTLYVELKKVRKITWYFYSCI